MGEEGEGRERGGRGEGEGRERGGREGITLRSMIW